VFEGEIGGLRIAATHGILVGQVEMLLDSQKFDYVLRGHSHRRQEHFQEKTALINPGRWAVCAYKNARSAFWIRRHEKSNLFICKLALDIRSAPYIAGLSPMISTETTLDVILRAFLAREHKQGLA
jgi:predicted phosphodiesterase